MEFVEFKREFLSKGGHTLIDVLYLAVNQVWYCNYTYDIDQCDANMQRSVHMGKTKIVSYNTYAIY